MDQAPIGLAGYDLQIILSDPGIARITKVVLPLMGLTEVSDLPGNRVNLQAVDTSDLVKPGSANVVLATLTVEGLAEGVTAISTTILALDSDLGTDIPIVIQPGQLVVEKPLILQGQDGPVRDLDGDGFFEDLNGNHRLDFNDVVVLFQYLADPLVQAHWVYFDYNENGRLDFDDVVELFHRT